MKKYPFMIGDLVYITTGYAPREVMGYEQDGKMLVTRYVRKCDASFNDHHHNPYRHDHAPLRATSMFRIYTGSRDGLNIVTRTPYALPEMKSKSKSNQKEKTMKIKDPNPLYQTKEETPRFGRFLSTTSTGQIALEMAPTDAAPIPGAILTFDPKDVEIVRPYTIRLAHLGSSNDFPVTVDADKGFKVDDLVYSEYEQQILRVTAINTKDDVSTDDVPFGKLRRIKMED